MIFVVATPIGNLGDISERALDVLRSVDKIAAEDTRHSRHLLAHYAITTPLIALHEHNERELSKKLIEDGENLALISDAGTPLISDPGYHLVKYAHSMGVPVVPIPGASAVICALSASGVPTDRFCFEGFLPAKSGARANKLTSLQKEIRTMVFYEAPHRILDTLQHMSEILGPKRLAAVAREMTKQFETIRQGTLEQLVHFVAADTNQQRGELVIVVAGLEPQDAELDDEAKRVLDILLAEVSVKQASTIAAKITGLNKNLLYQAALDAKGTSDS